MSDMDSSFNTWHLNNSSILNSLLYREAEDSRWAKCKGIWKEKKGEKILQHTCLFTCDLSNGNLYTDCTVLTIWKKCFCLSVLRPFVGVGKTAYHVFFPISIPLEIYKAYQEKKGASFKDFIQTAEEKIKNSLFDIFRTPLYTLALTIISVAAVIIGPFTPSKLYEFRKFYGHLEQELNRGDPEWTCAPCFQPIENLMNVDQWNLEKEDTEYELDPIDKGLNNLTRGYVKFKRKNCDLFQCRFPVGEESVYESPH